MSDYEFNLPFPPSINGYWRTFEHRQIIARRGRNYRILVSEFAKAHGIYKEMLECRIKVKLTLEPPTKRKYDIDNFCKALFDGLTHCGFWVDDEQIDLLSIAKGKKRKGGNVKVEVWLLGDGDAPHISDI